MPSFQLIILTRKLCIRTLIFLQNSPQIKAYNLYNPVYLTVRHGFISSACLWHRGPLYYPGLFVSCFMIRTISIICFHFQLQNSCLCHLSKKTLASKYSLNWSRVTFGNYTSKTWFFSPCPKHFNNLKPPTLPLWRGSRGHFFPGSCSDGSWELYWATSVPYLLAACSLTSGKEEKVALITQLPASMQGYGNHRKRIGAWLTIPDLKEWLANNSSPPQQPPMAAQEIGKGESW